MAKYIVLFRGINVGGKNLLPMKELVPVLTQYGFADVCSYIQSGNVVLSSESNPGCVIKQLVLKHFDFSPELFLLEEKSFETVISNNPFKGFEGKFVHFYICRDVITINQEKLTSYLAESEEFVVNDKVFYLHAPKGIGRSKLVANIEAVLDQTATGRNLNTMNKLEAMLTK